jgi:Bacterial conjugation TrbI-like protein
MCTAFGTRGSRVNGREGARGVDLQFTCNMWTGTRSQGDAVLEVMDCLGTCVILDRAIAGPTVWTSLIMPNGCSIVLERQLGASDVITALRRGSSDSLNQTGQKVVQQNLNVQPTLTVRPGFPVRVIVNRDLVLEPYKG